jgi:hypothetical protein
MSVITHKRLTSAFVKAGCTVESDERNAHRFVVKNPKNGRVMEWYTQAAFVPAKDGKEASFDDGNPVTTYVVERSPHTDIMSDCFCDTFHHSIKAAVAAIAR